VFAELIDCKADIFRYLPKQNRRQVATLMKGNRCASARTVAKLLMRSALPHFEEAQLMQDRDNFSRFQDGDIAHDLGNDNVLNPDKLRLKLRLAIFEKHGDDLAKIFIKFVEGCPLRVGTWKTRHEADEQAGLWITLDYGGIDLHGHTQSSRRENYWPAAIDAQLSRPNVQGQGRRALFAASHSTDGLGVQI